MNAPEPPDAEFPPTSAEARTIALALASRFEERGLQSTVHAVERSSSRLWRLGVDVVAPRVSAEIVVFGDGAWEVTVWDASDEFLDVDYRYPSGPPDFAAILEGAYAMIAKAEEEAPDPPPPAAAEEEPSPLPGPDEPPLFSTEEAFVRIVRLGVERRVRAGVAPPERIYRREVDLNEHPLNAARFTPEMYARMPEIVRRVVREEIARHIQEQQGWGETEFDRLDLAFEELERRRIATFPAVNVVPYRLVGGDQIWWFEQAMKIISARPWRGYVYWEEWSAFQCFEHGRFPLPTPITEERRLAAGSLREIRALLRELAEEVFGVLRDFGLRPILNEHGIYLEFDWRRRRPLSDLAW